MATRKKMKTLKVPGRLSIKEQVICFAELTSSPETGKSAADGRQAEQVSVPPNPLGDCQGLAVSDYNFTGGSLFRKRL